MTFMDDQNEIDDKLIVSRHLATLSRDTTNLSRHLATLSRDKDNLSRHLATL